MPARVVSNAARVHTQVTTHLLDDIQPIVPITLIGSKVATYLVPSGYAYGLPSLRRALNRRSSRTVSIHAVENECAYAHGVTHLMDC